MRYTVNKILYSLLFTAIAPLTFAGDFESTVVTNSQAKAVESANQVQPSPPANPNAGFIGRYNYFQNPYNWMMSGGGTLKLTESQIESQTVAQKLFEGGTYNVFGGGTYNQWDSQRYPAGISYGGNIFGQTGQIAGFSAGGVLSIMNPFSSLNSQINGGRSYSQYIPTFTQITLSEAFIEYQYQNIVNADIGYIAFDNSPWLAGNMYTNMLTVPTTYQGVGVNIYTGGGWLLSALAFNGAQFGAAPGYTGQTNYSSWLQTRDGYSTNSAGTAAMGANYASNDGAYNLRLWGYQFDNYGTLLYGDSSVSIPVSSHQSFNISAQFGSDQQWFQSVNAISQSTSGGAIQSYIAGAKIGWSYDEFSLNASANTMWGPSGAYGNGAFVSPYTQSLQVDPLYSEAWSYNMVTQGIPGNMYKLGGQFALGSWGTNLIFQPSYVYVASDNTNVDGLQEMDLVLNYPIPQVRGLYLFGVYAQQWYNQQATNVSNNLYQQYEIQSGIYYTW
jgi:hypothetical protein